MSGSAPDSAFVSRMIRAGDLEFETWVAGEGDRLALLLHGFPETRLSWRHQVEPLTRLGFTVWAPNLRGYGRSTRPSGVKSYKMDALMGDVAALTSVAASEGLRPSLLVGHDWGGAVAWSSLITQRVRFERFVAMNIPHPLLMRRRLWRPSQLRRSWYIFFFQLPWLPEWALTRRGGEVVRRAFLDSAIDRTRFPDDVLQGFVDQALAPGAMTAMLNYYRASAPAFYLEDYSRTLDVPTLLLWGEADVALGMHDLVPGTDELVSDFTFRSLPRVSHWVQQEAPEAVNAMMEAWLNGEPVPTADELGQALP